VVVATIQRNFYFKYYALKTEVAKVFLTTVIDQELVDPNPKDCEKQLKCGNFIYDYPK